MFKRLSIGLINLCLILNIKAYNESLKDVFDYIYKNEIWGSGETLSGAGSTLYQTETVREVIHNIIKEFKITSILDAPCGDFNWMKHMNFGEVSYLGVDIVESVIKQNKEKYKSNNIDFDFKDITVDYLPQKDLIICRDCLQHLSLNNVKKALNNFKKSGAAYLLVNFYTNTSGNWNISNGDYYRINLLLDPFNLPKPIVIYNENQPKEASVQRQDVSLGLWKLDDIQFFAED